jgi:hypothetical protein
MSDISNEIRKLQEKILELEKIQKEQENEFEPNFAILNDIFKKHIQTGVVLKQEFYERRRKAIGTFDFHNMEPSPEDYEIITHKTLNLHMMHNMAAESYQMAEAFLNILKSFNDRLTKLEEKR